MMHRVVLSIAAAVGSSLLAAGCSIAPEKAPPMEVYDLGPPADPRASAPSLAVSVDAPHWRQGTGLYYRFAHTEPARLRQYSQHRWAAPPADLLAQRLEERIGATPPVRTRFRLDVTLHAFEQIFTRPDAADVLIEARARLARTDSGQTVAARTFQLRESAPGANAEGAASGLVELSGELTAELLDWAAAQTKGSQ